MKNNRTLEEKYNKLKAMLIAQRKKRLTESTETETQELILCPFKVFGEPGELPGTLRFSITAPVRFYDNDNAFQLMIRELKDKFGGVGRLEVQGDQLIFWQQDRDRDLRSLQKKIVQAIIQLLPTVSSQLRVDD